MNYDLKLCSSSKVLLSVQKTWIVWLLYINQVCLNNFCEWCEFSFLVENLLYGVCCAHEAAESTESHPCISTWMSAHSEAVLAVCPHKHSSPLGGGQIGFLCLRSRHVACTQKHFYSSIYYNCLAVCALTIFLCYFISLFSFTFYVFFKEGRMDGKMDRRSAATRER